MSRHSHSHAAPDFSVVSHERGLRTVQQSFYVLLATALIQAVIVLASHSVALLADMVHNLGDAATALPLGIAFIFARFKPNKRFTYGYGRVEDAAGAVVILLILFSALVAGFESIHRFLHPHKVSHLRAVALASVISFAGNEAVAYLRIKTGKEIGSAALVADGYHARVDGWASLAVLAGALGIRLGFPLADPLAGLFITLSILAIVGSSGKSIFLRMLDGVEPELIEEIRSAADGVPDVKKTGDIRARWIGHKLYADINISVKKEASVSEGHEIAKEVSHRVLHRVPQLGEAIIHVDPEDKLGAQHHRHDHEHCI